MRVTLDKFPSKEQKGPQKNNNKNKSLKDDYKKKGVTLKKDCFFLHQHFELYPLKHDQ